MRSYQTVTSTYTVHLTPNHWQGLGASQGRAGPGQASCLFSVDPGGGRLDCVGSDLSSEASFAALPRGCRRAPRSADSLLARLRGVPLRSVPDMGCGASREPSQPQLFMDEDEPLGRRPSLVIRTIGRQDSSSQPLQLVRNTSGDQAVIELCEDLAEDDLQKYHASVQRAERAAAAAAKGALRSSMRYPSIDFGHMRTQARVLKLSLQPSVASDGSSPSTANRTINLRIAPV